MSTAFDRLNAACLRHFGKGVIYTPADGAAVEMRGIRNEAGEPEGVAPGVKARWFFQEADFAAPPEKGDTLTVGAAVYEIERVDVDEEGGVTVWGRKR